MCTVDTHAFQTQWAIYAFESVSKNLTRSHFRDPSNRKLCSKSLFEIAHLVEAMISSLNRPNLKVRSASYISTSTTNNTRTCN